jgi:hypothetical protein
VQERKKRRPYKPPTVQTEKVFERRALACPKVKPPAPITPPPCRGQYKAS